MSIVKVYGKYVYFCAQGFYGLVGFLVASLIEWVVTKGIFGTVISLGFDIVPSGTESYNTVHSATDKSIIYVNDNVQPNPVVCGYHSCSFGNEI